MSVCGGREVGGVFKVYSLTGNSVTKQEIIKKKKNPSLIGTLSDAPVGSVSHKTVQISSRTT